MSGLFRSLSGSAATQLPDDALSRPMDPAPSNSPPRSIGNEEIGMAMHETNMLTPLSDSSESVPFEQSRVPETAHKHEKLQSLPASILEDITKNNIKRHEGFKDHVYPDSLKKPTIGYGHLISEGDKFISGIIYDKRTLDELFEIDFQKAKNAANDILKGMDIDDRARGIVTEMVFQLGKGGVSKFSGMRSALSKETMPLLRMRCWILFGTSRPPNEARNWRGT